MDIVVSPTTVAFNAQSGAHNAGAPGAARPGHAPEQPTPEGASPIDPLAEVVVALAAHQNGFGPLLANAAAALHASGLPPAIRLALAQLLALRPQLDALSPDMLKQAIERSGLFFEARIAADASAVAVPDFKVALLSLREVLKTWLGTPLPSAIAPPQSSPPSASEKPGPPPPYRDAPMAAQAPAEPTLDAATPPREIGQVLLSEADNALARQTLMQAASLPDRDTQQLATSARWNFEIPFAAPPGSAVGQFEIARDGRHAPAEGLHAVWRVRFSIDVAPLGPVHAHIALTGTRASVNIWAERQATALALSQGVGQLTEALQGAALDPGGIVVRAGEPPRQQQQRPSGRFLDRAS